MRSAIVSNSSCSRSTRGLISALLGGGSSKLRTASRRAVQAPRKLPKALSVARPFRLLCEPYAQQKSVFRERVADFFKKTLRAGGRRRGRGALLSKVVAHFF